MEGKSRKGEESGAAKRTLTPEAKAMKQSKPPAVVTAAHIASALVSELPPFRSRFFRVILAGEVYVDVCVCVCVCWRGGLSTRGGLPYLPARSSASPPHAVPAMPVKIVMMPKTASEF